MGIKLDYASVYHPQTNGQVEHANALIMSGIKPRLVRSLKESDTHWVEELDSVLWGLRTMPNRTIGYTPFFMVYGAEAVLPCDIIHDPPRMRMYEEKEAELDRQDNLDALEEERDVAKPVPHSISNRLEGIKAEKYGPKLITLVNSSYAYLRRKRTSSNPSGRVPSSLIKFSPEEHTVYAVHLITDSSRIHGTRPDAGDSTPSTEPSVRLLTSTSSVTFFFFLSCPLFPFCVQPCKTARMP